MCKMMEDMRKDVKIETARRMLSVGKLSYEEIARCSDLTVDEVKALDEKKSA